MSFNELLKKISPILKRIAASYSRPVCLCAEEDLYQEMCMHLWNNFKRGMPPGVNYSYIIKGCQFHLLNYLRKTRPKVKVSSLDEVVNENGDTLKDLLADTSEPLEEYLERKISIDDIKNNGFSKREKQVFSLLLSGLTVRQAGERLGISHVMVLKYKHRLISKWQKKEDKR
ncbi:MAG: sigma-70 family RNA polymerase sigma factor [Candidatus Omnitrophota bacterium]